MPPGRGCAHVFAGLLITPGIRSVVVVAPGSADRALSFLRVDGVALRGGWLNDPLGSIFGLVVTRNMPASIRPFRGAFGVVGLASVWLVDTGRGYERA